MSGEENGNHRSYFHRRLLTVSIVILFLFVGCFIIIDDSDSADAFVDNGLEYVIIGSNARVSGYTGSPTSVTIPAVVTNGINYYDVTSIGSYAFYRCTSLESITIPDSVTSIGSNAFSECTSLESITIPDSVTSIGSYAFDYCTSLVTVTIPNSVTSIGERAFCECTSLFEVINLSSLNIVKGSTDNGYAGYYAMNVFTSAGDSTVGTIDGKFVYGRSSGINYLVKYRGSNPSETLPVTINGGDYRIYSYAFYGCRTLTSVTIPDSVIYIENRAFAGCKSLISVNIPNSVTTIEDCAFFWCTSLASLTIGNSVTYIGDGAFDGCTSLFEVINLSSLNIVKGSTDNLSSLNIVKGSTDRSEEHTSQHCQGVY